MRTEDGKSKKAKVKSKKSRSRLVSPEVMASLYRIPASFTNSTTPGNGGGFFLAVCS